ncbi:MAG: hypothetical protein PT956_03565 [Firmicutes bacterium]|nr:hypothetical protein [Bacillota bacterium]
MNLVIYSLSEVKEGEVYIDEQLVGELELIDCQSDRSEYKIIYKGIGNKDKGYPFLMMLDTIRLNVRLIFEDDSELTLSSARVLVTTKNIADQKNIDEMIYYIIGAKGLSNDMSSSYNENSITLNNLNRYLARFLRLYNNYRQFYEVGVAAGNYKNNIEHKPCRNCFIGGTRTCEYRIDEEREAIMNFIYELYSYSIKIHHEIIQLTKQNEIKYNRLLDSIPEGYSAPVIVIYHLRIETAFNSCAKLASNISKMKSILIRNGFHKDRVNKKVILREHFINPIFWEYMNKWKNARKMNIKYHEFYFSIDSLDKLYEYYCLARILEGLRAMGYRPGELRDAQFYYESKNDIFQNEVHLFNTFYREKDGIKLTLYFQPLIYRHSDNNKIGLIRTTGGDSNFTNFNKTGEYYSPDFILKFEGKSTKYLILDAKYQTRNTILRGHMDQIISKYFTQIRSIDGKRDQMVYVLQGRVDGDTDNWAYENVDQISDNFYSDFGIFQFSPDVNKNTDLMKLIARLEQEVK